VNKGVAQWDQQMGVLMGLPTRLERCACGQDQGHLELVEHRDTLKGAQPNGLSETIPRRLW
jgi:hypothetical protein